MRAVIRQFGLQGGLAEGEDPKQAPPGTLGVLENCVQRKIGRVDKRWGSAYRGRPATSVRRLFTRENELCAIGGDGIVYSYSGAAGFLARGNVPEVGLTWSVANDTVNGAKAADVAFVSASSATVHAWITGDPGDQLVGGELWVQTKDDTTGAILVAPSRLSAAGNTDCTRVRIVTDGTNNVILTVAAGNLIAHLNGGAPVTLQTDVHNPGIGKYTYNAFDACLIGTEFVVAYAKSGGGINLVRYSFGLVQQAKVSVAAESSSAIQALAIGGAAGAELYILYSDNAGFLIRHAMANPLTLAQTLAPTTIVALTGSTDATLGVHRLGTGGAIYAYSYTGAAANSEEHGVLKTRYVQTNGTLRTPLYTSFAKLLTRPFTLNSRQYVYACDFASVVNVGTSVADAYLLEVTPDLINNPSAPHRQVGKTELLTSGRWYVGQTSDVPLRFGDATRAIAALPFTGDGKRQGMRDVRASAGASVPTDMWRSASMGAETYLTGGVYAAYDGAAVLPYSFAHPGYINVGATVAATGGSLAAGTYLYNTVPERRSAAGILHRGPTGIALSKVVAAGGKVTLDIVPVNQAYSSEAELIAVYRSLVNNTDATLHRLTIEPGFAVVLNTATQTLSLVDTTPDASVGGSTGLAVRPAIYTAGGELDDYQPPSCLTQALHRSRLFLLSGDEQTVFFSKYAPSNVGVAPGFHPSQRFYFPEPIVALASMDDKFIALSETRPWFVVGDGPAPDGGQSDYIEPTPIQSDVGCINPRSVVVTPDGVMFQSPRGLSLLTRGLEVKFVGAAVDDTLEAFPVITSAVLIPNQNQVRWTCNSSDGTAGRTIVYDYFTGQWSIFRYANVTLAVSDTPIADAILWNGVWTFVTPTGHIYYEVENTWFDSGTWFTMRGETTWIDEGGPLGYAHIRRAMLLGDVYSRCRITLRFGFNHSSTWAQEYEWTWAQLAAFNDGINVGMRVGSQDGASPRARAFRVGWEDAFETVEGGGGVDTGQGFNLSAIGIEFIPKPDMDRRSAKART